MNRIPVLKPREVMRILNSLGFILVRQRGYHWQFCHADGRVTTVSDHKDRGISPFLLRQIARDIGMNLEEFLKHR